jgi:hypothetical protein
MGLMVSLLMVFNLPRNGIDPCIMIKKMGSKGKVATIPTHESCQLRTKLLKGCTPSNQPSGYAPSTNPPSTKMEMVITSALVLGS